MKSSWKVAVGVAAVAGGVALPAGAGAMTTRPDVSLGAPFAPCYAAPRGTVPPISIPMSGGGASDPYVVSATYPNTAAGEGDAGSTDGDFDANGNATAVLSDLSPVNNDRLLPSPGDPITLDVEDYTLDQGTVDSPLGTITVSQEGVFIYSTPRNPLKPRLVTAADIAWAGQPIYGFITNKAGTRVLRKFSLGTGNACGYTKAKVVASPPGARSGQYALFVTASKTLNKSAAIKDPFHITRY